MSSWLIASIALNVVLAGGVAEKLRRIGPQATLERLHLRRRAPNDFAAIGSTRWDRQPLGENAVVFVGDSQVQNAPLLDMFTPYRQRGIGGATAGDVAAWVNPIRAAKPAHVVLMVGTNDVNLGRSTAEMLADVKALVEGFECAVTLLSVPPMPAHLPAVTEFNAALSGYAEAAGCQWIDLTATLSGMQWTDDGVHLTHAAYLAIASKFAALVP